MSRASASRAPATRRRRVGRLVGVEPDLDRDLGRVVALAQPEVGARLGQGTGQPGGIGSWGQSTGQPGQGARPGDYRLCVRGETFRLSESGNVGGDAPAHRGRASRRAPASKSPACRARSRTSRSWPWGARGSGRRRSPRRWPGPRATKHGAGRLHERDQSAGSAVISSRCSGATTLQTSIACAGPSTRTDQPP